MLGSVPTFALLASRFLNLSGGTDADLCAVATSARAGAAGSPQAVNRAPLDADGYYASRMIATPLRVLDCARPYDAVRPAKVSHVPSKTETLVRDMGDGHSEIDYATEYRRLDEEFVWFGRLKREKVPGYIEALESAHGAAVVHDALVIGPPHTLIYPNLFLAEMNVMTVEPLSSGETIAYTTPVLIPGAPELNRRTLRRTEGAMGRPASSSPTTARSARAISSAWPPARRSG